MKRMTLALGALVLALTAAAPAPVNAGWLLIRWSDGWCQIWDDFNANAKPIGPGWTQLNARPYPNLGNGLCRVGEIHPQADRAEVQTLVVTSLRGRQRSPR